jgi:hypothetical protein
VLAEEAKTERGKNVEKASHKLQVNMTASAILFSQEKFGCSALVFFFSESLFHEFPEDGGSFIFANGFGENRD